jgi:hypothetical protein
VGIKINGATSGSVSLTAPASGSDVTVTLPETAGTLPTIPSVGSFMVPLLFERNSVGTAGNMMAVGNGAVNITGVRMPFAGKIVAGSLHGTTITGTITLDVYVNGVANTSYRLTGTGSASNVNATGDWRSSPLTFAAGTLLSYVQTAVPTAANGYVASMFVVFD